MKSTFAAWAALLPLAASIYFNGSMIAPCDSEIYCIGNLLKEIELARPFVDSKTFVDLPTIRPLNEVLEAFSKLERPIQNNTALNDFLKTYFGEAGSELAEIDPNQLETQPEFLDNVNSSTVKDFVRQVIDIWPDLTRKYAGSPNPNCTECVDSFLPIARPFVVAGGRFREPYYWDSFWVIEGLLRTKGSFTEIAYNMIENFLDFVDRYGFVPNGARLYYLNRSQPPLLTQMIRIYIEQTHNSTILQRAMPLLEKEYDFWVKNRTVELHRGGKTYSLSRYAVLNTEPRPESYREDYVTANNVSYYNKKGEVFNGSIPLDPAQKAQLYANLASGAESGFDYSARWLRNPNDAISDTSFPLRSLNTYNIIPVELNSILYANEKTIANFYRSLGNYTAAKEWANRADARQEAMTAIFWDEEHFGYFDYNLTSGAKAIYVPSDRTARQSDTEGAPEGYQIWQSPTQFYPFWTGAAPDELLNNASSVRRAYRRISEELDAKAGAISASNLITGQQWDEPNGLLNTPVDENEGSDEDYVWTQELALRLAQRYLDSTFCTWRVTGGSTPEFPKLEGVREGSNGTMFEKYSDNSTNAAGSGGEYKVVEGFGWTNGVLIWIADVFGQSLKTPDCGNITAAHIAPQEKRSLTARSAVHLAPRDAAWTKKFGKRAQ
ncbi:trehalase precursor [Westerdykella ornata]|uniref:Trehalase n=1 Tax=Westerdykella ornata TaxID=318751 RepID=A0A6A6JHK4_WESOR|nr:trehalase precursor [Westerdykella ornata]KAF2274729.1 trehalase precursor [Westerdykella ornata]